MFGKNNFFCIITLKNKIKSSYSNGVNDKYYETFKKYMYESDVSVQNYENPYQKQWEGKHIIKLQELPILNSQTYEHISQTLNSNNYPKHRIKENVI